MWISNKKYTELCARLQKLEAWKVNHGSEHELIVYKKYSELPAIWACDYSSARISLPSVINAILTHVGLEMVYVDGQEKRVEIKKKKKDER